MVVGDWPRHEVRRDGATRRFRYDDQRSAPLRMRLDPFPAVWASSRPSWRGLQRPHFSARAIFS